MRKRVPGGDPAQDRGPGDHGGAPEPPQAQIIDLMEALKASLAAKKAAAQAARPTEGRRPEGPPEAQRQAALRLADGPLAQVSPPASPPSSRGRLHSPA